jgi:ketosteroid isomerase-like protein
MDQPTRPTQERPHSAGSDTPDTTHHDESAVQAFLDRLARAITSGDTATVAKLWETPALVLSDQEVFTVGSPQEVEGFFAGAKDRYNEQGITDTRADVRTFEWATDRMVVVDVRWPYLDAQGNERGDERSTYVLRRDDAGELRLRVALMRGASKRFGHPEQGRDKLA